MRRKDREITSLNEIVEIIDKCDVCRIALSENNIPYIVPMNFGFEVIDKTITLYFHCASDGKKLDILRKNNNVCFEMDCGHELLEGKNACSYSMKYESVIGNAIAEFITDINEKEHALNMLMKKYTSDKEHNFNEEMLNMLTIFKLKTTEFTGKRRA
jgi:nitroimidazol reductase NimA-like FMN-containing flavoprotein (pyridoxamine 5'-phosphate oxidase superfamily)